MQLARAGAAAEAYHGIYLIFELLLPSRNIMQLYIWWQYLRMRYMLDTTGTRVSTQFSPSMYSGFVVLFGGRLLVVVDNIWRPVYVLAPLQPACTCALHYYTSRVEES
jgi:hypothetical protein